MKKLLFLSFLLVSLNVRAGIWGNIPTSDLDFDFLRVKVRELLNDAVATAVLFDEEIIKNGDQDKFDEMPTKRLKIGLNALASGDRKGFNVKYEEFESNIDNNDQKIYEDNNLLMFGPLNRIDRAVGNFGYFGSILEIPVLTTVKPLGEVMLPKKVGTLAKFEECLENAEEVKELTKKIIYEVAKEIMTEGSGQVL